MQVWPNFWASHFKCLSPELTEFEIQSGLLGIKDNGDHVFVGTDFRRFFFEPCGLDD